MHEVQLQHFQDLLDACRHQPSPQRLLFVFTLAEMPEGATPAQKQQVESGRGGHLAPHLCVDKLAAEIGDFQALLEESARTGQHWDILFVSSLPGVGDIPPNTDQARQPLQMMVEAVRSGRIADFAAFDRSGHAVSFY